VSHLVVEYLFTSLSGVRMEHIPFTGAAPALTAAMASQVEVASTTMPPAVALVNAAKLKGVAVTSAERSAVLPQVPTVAEAGLKGIPVTAWTGLFVPARTPDAVINRLSQAVLLVAEMPDVKNRLAQLGFEPTSVPGEQFRRELSTEIKMWADVVQKAGIKLP
jgi:tripartite-type tricarboxylate transporter receptor subunit TctC